MTSEIAQALYDLARNYHSGQWSRGYRLMCAVQRHAMRHGIRLHDRIIESPLYLSLIERYRHIL
jgi:hypothetical protein